MVRKFDGSKTNEARCMCSIGNCNITGAISMALILETPALAGAKSILMSLWNTVETGLEKGTNGYAMGLNYVGKQITFKNKAGSELATPFTTLEPNKKYLFGVTKPAGKNKLRWHLYDFAAKKWTHESSVSELEDGLSCAGGSVQFGRVGSEFPRGEQLAGGAIWNKVLSDAEFEALIGANFEAWKSTSPSGLWTFGQVEVGQTVKDWTGGGANEFFRNSTEVVSASPPLSYSIPEQISWMNITDTLKHASKPGTMTKIPWATAEGTWVEATGWSPSSFIEKEKAEDHSGFYLSSEEQSENWCVGIRKTTGSLASAARTMNLWLFSPMGATPGGYQLTLVTENSGSLVKFVLKKWVEGVEIGVLLEVKGVTLAEQDSFFLAKVGNKLSLYHRVGEALLAEQIGTTVEDTTFSKGFSAFAGNGSNPKFINLIVGKLESTSEEPTAKTVKILKEGSIVAAKRYVLRNGELVNT